MKQIPSIKGLPGLGTILSIISAGGAPKLHLYVDRRHKELGPIFREKIGPVSGVFISDANYMRQIFGAEGKYPKHIVPEAWLLYNKMYKCKRGLLFMDDEEWLAYRRIMNNILLKVKQDVFWQAANFAAENLVQNWRKQEEITDMEGQLYRWSLEFIIMVLSGTEKHVRNEEEISQSIERLSKIVHQIFKESANLSLLPVKIAVRLKLPAWKRFVFAASSAVEEGKNLVEKILELENKNHCENSLIHQMLKSNMNLQDLISIVTDLILAAGDTTAHTTQWLLHVLSVNLSSQTLIYNELQSQSNEEIFLCPLLKGSLREALRLYPVSPFITRILPNDLFLEDYQIRSQELVLMSLYSSGRNEKYFPEPDLFLPQRWIRKDKSYEGVINPYASLPFAMGSRSCIGKKMAEIQILGLISKILKNFVVKSNNTEKIDIKLHLIAIPEKPITIKLEPRQMC